MRNPLVTVQPASGAPDETGRVLVKRADWVVCAVMPDGPVGLVRRIARDGSWADVDWRTHVKRMKTKYLVVRHTIGLGGGLSIEDSTRKAEIDAAVKAASAAVGR